MVQDSARNGFDSTSWKGDIKAVVIAAFGHILASAPFDKSKSAKIMRDFILREQMPVRYRLFLFIYPYDECLVYRDCAPFSRSPNSQSVIQETMSFSGLYFWPLAFLLGFQTSLGDFGKPSKLD